MLTEISQAKDISVSIHSHRSILHVRSEILERVDHWLSPSATGRTQLEDNSCISAAVTAGGFAVKITRRIHNHAACGIGTVGTARKRTESISFSVQLSPAGLNSQDRK